MGDHRTITFVGSAGASAINGGNATITLPSFQVSDVNYVTVTLGTSKASTLTVTTSSGFAYTQASTTVASSYARFGVFRRILASTGETQVTVTGTGGSTDCASGIAFLLRGEDTTTPEDATATSTTGASTTPDSPSITVASCGCAIISAIGIALGGPAVPTAPSGYLNSITRPATDTNPAVGGMAWTTNNTTAAFDPTAWGSSLSASWCSATIAVRPAAFTWQLLTPLSEPDIRSVEIVGY